LKKTTIAIVLICLSLALVITGCATLVAGPSAPAPAPVEAAPAPGETTPAQTPAPEPAPGGTAGQTINVHNWGYFIDRDVLRIFEEETGIRVNYHEFVNNETLYAALNLGGMVADVIVPSDYMIARMIAEDMLYELNFDNIPNYTLIDPRFRNMEFDPENRFSAAYKVGTTGLIWNSAMIPYEITGWGSLFDERFDGTILMFNNPRDAFAVALQYLGYDINTVDEGELQEAFELLVAQRPILQAYVMDEIFDKMESGEAWIAPWYAPDFLIMYEHNPDLRFVRPAEGTNFFVNAMVVPRGSENREAAEQFINFMLRTDIALMNMRLINYASANYEAAAIFAAELDPLARDVVFVGPEDYAKSDVFLHLPQTCCRHT